MTTAEFLSSAALILSMMATISLIELAVPLFARPTLAAGRRRANLAMTAQALFMGWLLSSLAALAALVFPLASASPLSIAGLPPLLQLGLGVIALDFAFGYAAHRTMHAWPPLWKFHRVHHSDPFVDTTTSFRTHPVENMWRHAWLFGTVWLLGIPAAAVAAFRALSALNGVLEHANIRLPHRLDTALSAAWVTPNMHKVHHSRDQAQTDSNYGNLLSLHDRIFSTFVPTRVGSPGTELEFAL